jgi:hypothetical protein
MVRAPTAVALFALLVGENLPGGLQESLYEEFANGKTDNEDFVTISLPIPLC